MPSNSSDVLEEPELLSTQFHTLSIKTTEYTIQSIIHTYVMANISSQMTQRSIALVHSITPLLRKFIMAVAVIGEEAKQLKIAPSAVRSGKNLNIFHDISAPNFGYRNR